jgi:hypothetical protein
MLEAVNFCREQEEEEKANFHGLDNSLTRAEFHSCWYLCHPKVF